MKDPRRVLLIARDMMGDLVNTTGAVDALLRHFPEAQFDIECGPPGTQLFPGLSDRIQVIPRARHGGLLGRLARVQQFKRGNYDLALVLDPSRTHIRVAAWAGIPKVVGPARKPGAIRHAEVLDVSQGEHDLFPSLEAVLRAVGVEPSLAPVIPLKDDHRKWAQEIPLSAGAGGWGGVGLFIGASDLAKRWPRWHELTPREGWIAMAGPGEESLLENLKMPKLPRPPNLLAFAAALKRLDVLVTADTGPAHLAAAVGTPCVVLYGPTNPKRYHPWPTEPPHVLLHHPSPCDHYGAGCAFKDAGICTQKCMGAISASEVHAAVDRLLSRRT